MHKSCFSLVLAMLAAGCANSKSENPTYEFAAAKEGIYPTGYDLVRQFNQSVLDAGHQVRYGEKTDSTYFDEVPAQNLRHISDRELSASFVSKFLTQNVVGTALVPLLDGKVATITGFGGYFDIKVSRIEQPCELDYSKVPYRCPDLKQPVYILYKRVKEEPE